MRPLSDHQHFSRTIRNSYPPSPYLSSMPSMAIPPREFCSLRIVSLSSFPLGSETDSSSSPLPPPAMNTFRPPYSSFKEHVTTGVVRLAEEEKIDV